MAFKNFRSILKRLRKKINPFRRAFPTSRNTKLSNERDSISGQPELNCTAHEIDGKKKLFALNHVHVALYLQYTKKIPFNSIQTANIDVLEERSEKSQSSR